MGNGKGHFAPIDSSESTGFVKAVRTFTHIVSPPVIYAVLGFALALAELPLLPALAWGTLYGVLVALCPIIYVVYLLKAGKITDINMTKEERRIPYLVGVFFALVAVAVFHFGNGPHLVFCLTLINFVVLAIMGVINLSWQISNHATSIISAVLILGVVFGDFVGWALSPLILIVCAARLYLRRHTPYQIAGGLALGTIAVMTLVLTGCFGG